MISWPPLPLLIVTIGVAGAALAVKIYRLLKKFKATHQPQPHATIPLKSG